MLGQKHGIQANQDVRCSAVGNSFHTGVVSAILRQGLVHLYPGLDLPTPTQMAESYFERLSKTQKESIRLAWRKGITGGQRDLVRPFGTTV